MEKGYGYYGMVALLSLFPIGVAFYIPWDLNDDAYITLNYAQNLADGRGFVYNHGPASQGTTTPLLTLLMAGCAWRFPGLRLDGMAVVFSALCWASIPWVLTICRRAWHLSRRDALVVSSVLILFANYYGLGMEAYLFGALLLWTCTLALSGHFLCSGVSMGLLYLTRGEGILLALVFGTLALMRYSRKGGDGERALAPTLRALGSMFCGGALVVVPWMVFAHVQFGAMLPDTLGAKLAQSALGAPGFASQMLGRLGKWGSYLPGFSALTWGYHIVALLGLRRMIRLSHPLLLPIVWAVAYGEAYALLGVPYYWWYDLPLYHAWLLCVGMGLVAMVGAAPVARSLRTAIALKALVVVLLGLMTAQTIFWAATTGGYQKSEMYREVCEWLTEHAPPEATVATGEVGYIGFYLPNPIIDLAGLTSPEHIDVIASSARETLLWSTNPDYYVALDKEEPWMTLHGTSEFQARFEAVATFPAPDPWGRCRIFRRRSEVQARSVLSIEPDERFPQAIETPGRWNLRDDGAQDGLNPVQQADLEALDAIGYLSGSQVAAGGGGVVYWDQGQAAPGYNLYVSGHDTSATLMNMAGDEVHRWSHPFDRAWLGKGAAIRDDHPGLPFWRRAYLLPRGDLLVVFEGLGLLRLDRDSNVRWARFNRAHHAVAVQPSGALYALTFAGRLIPELHPTKPIRDDFVTILDGAGREVRRVSLWACFQGSAYESLVQTRSQPHGDIFHTNSLYVIRGDEGVSHPEFTAGRVLVSIFFLDTIALLDLDTQEVVWAQQGPYRFQHDAKLLPGGTLLLFDNEGLGGASRVLEWEVSKGTTQWQYPADGARTLYSPTCSTAYRLANGNTLLTESDNGRALEVTSSGEIIWEFHNPHRAGPADQYVATLFDLQRIPASEVESWVPFGGAEGE